MIPESRTASASWWQIRTSAGFRGESLELIRGPTASREHLLTASATRVYGL